MNFWWKFGVIIGCLTLCAFGGWHIRGWYDKSLQDKVDEDRIVQLGLGQQQVMVFGQAWSAATSKDATPCTLTPSERKLLR